ncbi:enoyl reductase [Salinibacterium sp. CAN_S4]|uniref:NADP-dependent oxidoreductase n=1 Tax=Salinibacterium sp. CAN_S4 TaxID=2787727 RepID=UPI0018F01B1B
MSRRVEYSQFGGPEVLHIVDVSPPHPGQGEVRVKVLAAGINPFDAKVFRGMPTSSKQKVQFPVGNGADFAGVIDEVGDGVSAFELGDAVMGGLAFSSQADFVIIAADKLIATPEGLTVEQAGSLNTAGRTAWASVRSLELGADDVVLVSAAAGGVGVIAVQLAKRTGATVIGSASVSNHDYLRSLGVIPVQYGDGMADAVRTAAPEGITAALDNFGHGFVETAMKLGAPASRINTIADYEAPEKYGVGAVGAAGASLSDLEALASLVADGSVDMEIDSVFPLERASEAYTRLLKGHLRGKIVLVTQ